MNALEAISTLTIIEIDLSKLNVKSLLRGTHDEVVELKKRLVDFLHINFGLKISYRLSK